MKKKQLITMLGAMTLALVLGAAPLTQSVLAAGSTGVMSQSAVVDALKDSDIIDVTRRGSVTIHKYDLTAAEAAGDYTAGSVRATGETNAEVEKKLADYAVSGVQFSCLRVGNVETHSVNNGTETAVELVYEIPEKLAGILGLTKADSIDMTSAKEAKPCQNTGVWHYTSQQISDALAAILKADNVSAKNALESYLYDYGTMDSTTDQSAAKGVINLPKTNAKGVTTIGDMDLGLYLFAETEVPEQVTETVNPWFVQLPFTNEGENGGDYWLYDMSVYPKNQTGNPTLDKSVRNAYSNTVSASGQAASGTDKNKSVHAGADYVSRNDSESLVVYHGSDENGNQADKNAASYVANRGGYTMDGVTAGKGGMAISTDFSYRDTTTASEGDVLDYILVSKLPHISTQTTYLSEYTFTDTLSKGIEYGKDVKIAFYDNAADANANNTAKAALLWNLASGDYSQNYVDVTVQDPNTGAHTSDGSTRMKVSLTEAGLKVINQGLKDVKGLEHGLSDYYMVVYYTATVNSDDSVILGDEGNPNNVSLIWSRTSDGFYNMLEDRNYVYSYGLNLTKTFSDQKGRFDHVKFKLYNSTDAYYVVAEKSTEKDGVYYVTGKTTDPKKATAFTPAAADGKLIVNGTEADTYQLTEIETDDGYNLLKDQIVIDISSTDRDVIASVAGVTGMDAEAVKAIVENYQGGVYDENGNLVTDQKDELSGTKAGAPTVEKANGRTIGKTDMYVGKIKSASATVDNISANMTEDNGVVLLSVNNTKGFLLPQTGGKGMYLVTILGAVAVAGGYCLVVRKKRVMKNKIRKAAALLLIFSGIFLAGYPWISNWLYGRTVASEVKVYEKQMKTADTVDTERQWSLARQYNKALAESVVALTDPFVATEEMEGASLQEQYETALCINEDGLMCFVEIPKIQVYLPVYHGTSEQVLKRGAGHLQSSALPVGERGCRPVISAHSGISNSKMFSDLTELEKGDVFFLHVLDQVFSYCVCDIQVIWPDETEQLLPGKDRDLVSLLTCTPYGVNTHRLVVTGEREEMDVTGLEEDNDHGAAGMPEVLESEWMKNYRRALEAGFAIIAGTVVCHLVMQKWRKMLRIHIAERGGNAGNEDRAE